MKSAQAVRSNSGIPEDCSTTNIHWGSSDLTVHLGVLRSASGVSMTGVCNVGEADEISACVWRIQKTDADGKQDNHKPQYHIEF